MTVSLALTFFNLWDSQSGSDSSEVGIMDADDGESQLDALSTMSCSMGSVDGGGADVPLARVTLVGATLLLNFIADLALVVRGGRRRVVTSSVFWVFVTLRADLAFGFEGPSDPELGGGEWNRALWVGFCRFLALVLVFIEDLGIVGCAILG